MRAAGGRAVWPGCGVRPGVVGGVESGGQAVFGEPAGVARGREAGQEGQGDLAVERVEQPDHARVGELQGARGAGLCAATRALTRSARSREHIRGVTWVAPVLVGEVVYRTLTSDQRLRHAAWRGLRTDRDPVEVVYRSALGRGRLVSRSSTRGASGRRCGQAARQRAHRVGGDDVHVTGNDDKLVRQLLHRDHEFDDTGTPARERIWCGAAGERGRR